MDKSYPLCTSMVVRSLDVNKGSFRHQENDEELFGLEVSYLSVIRAQMYLANYTQSDIAFVVKLVKQDIILLVLWYLI